MPNSTDKTTSGSNFFVFLLRNAKTVLVSAGVLFVLMLGYVLWGYVPSYSSNAAVLVKDSALKGRYLTDAAYETTSAETSSSILNVMNLVETQTVSHGVYNFLKARYPEELKKMDIRSVNDWHESFGDGGDVIKAKNKSGTDIITVKATWASQKPEISQGIADTVVKSLQQASLEVNRSEQSERYQYLSAQYERVKTNLEEIRRRIRNFQTSTNTINLDQEIMDMSNARVQLQKQLSEAIVEADGKRSQYKRLQSSMGLSPERALKAAARGGNPTLAKLYDKYYQLSQDYAQVSTMYTDESPKAAELVSQLKQTKKDINDELGRAGGAALSATQAAAPSHSFSDEAHMRTIGDLVQAQGEATMMTQRANSMRRELQLLDGRLRNVPSIKERSSNLQQQELFLSESLKSLQTQMLEAQLKETQTSSNVFIIDPAQLPTKADMPRIPHLLLLSLILGSGLGACIVYLQWRLFEASRRPFAPAYQQVSGNRQDDVKQVPAHTHN